MEFSCFTCAATNASTSEMATSLDHLSISFNEIEAQYQSFAKIALADSSALVQLNLCLCVDRETRERLGSFHALSHYSGKIPRCSLLLCLC